MDFSNPEDNLEEEKLPVFKPYAGDCLMKLKTNSPDDPIFLWRVVLTDKNVKKIWPEEHDGSCEHKDLYWAIDFNRKFITLCNDCECFSYGHKVMENE